MNPDQITALIGMLDKMVDEAIASDVVAIEAVTRDAISEQVRNGIVESLSTAQVAQAIDDIFKGFTDVRALRIARTEVGTASSYGQFSAAAVSGMTHKTWATAGDSDVRDQHSGELDGETVPLFDKFSNGGLFPLDSALPAAERINCRCSMTFSKRGAT